MKRIIHIFLILIISLLPVCFLQGCAANPMIVDTKPVRGQLTLSNQDLADKPIPLNGEWELYWKKLIDYEDITLNHRPDAYVQVPGYWDAYIIPEQGFNGTGYATYRLHVKLDRPDEHLGLKLSPMSSAYRVLINDNVVAESGVVTANAETTKTGYKSMVTIFDVPRSEFDLIVQVANHTFPRGGFWYPMYLGTEEQIREMQLHANQKEMFLYGSILIMMLYNLIIFLFHRKELSYLYLVLFTIAVLIYFSVSGEVNITRIFPGMPFAVANFLFYIGYIWPIIFLTGFMQQLYPDELKNGVFNRLLVVAAVFTLAILLFPQVAYKFVIPLYDYVIIVGCAYTVYRLIKAIKNNRQDASIMLMATIFIIVTGVHDMFYQRAIYLTPFHELLPIGVFVLILCQSTVLAKKFTEQHFQVQELSLHVQSLDKFNDEFLVHTSYELKSPLNMVSSLAHTIAESEGSLLKENKKNLELITKTVSNLSSLINMIVDLHQIREKRVALNIRSFDCCGAIRLVIQNLKTPAQEKGLKIINRLTTEKFKILADESRFIQIVYTLLENAIKYTESGQIVIEGYTSDDKAHITITDTGLGIADDRRKSLSVNLSRENDEINRPEAGPGLSFYIAGWLARYMGGDLRIRWTEVGKGTCVELTLPTNGVAGNETSGNEISGNDSSGNSLYKELNPNENNSIEEVAASSDVISNSDALENSINRPPENYPTVLIVEAEPTDLEYLKNFLGKRKYKCIVARTGEQAMSLLEQQRDISLVLLSLLLPDSTGYSVCQKIRAHYNLLELPVILMSIRYTPELLQEGLTAGANDFVTKPFVSSELNSRIQTHLELRNSLKKALDMEIMFLQSQIKPHFIYNAISVITSLCYIDGKRAGDLMIQFGNYLRRSFDIDYRNHEVRLEDEISLIKSYIEIEKARFGKRIQVEYDLDQEALNFKIPSLILQPLVENAIRHGILRRIEGGTVCIRARKDSHSLVLIVEDNGVGISHDQLLRLQALDAPLGKGVALKNINRRMQSYFKQVLEIQSEPNKGTSVSLRIPIRDH